MSPCQGLASQPFTDHLHNKDALNLAVVETEASGLQTEQLRMLSISCCIFHRLVSLKPLAGKDFTAHVAQPGFPLLLKFFQLEERFPEKKNEIPRIVQVFVAEQLGIPVTLYQEYNWQGRALKYHRAGRFRRSTSVANGRCLTTGSG